MTSAGDGFGGLFGGLGMSGEGRFNGEAAELPLWKQASVERTAADFGIDPVLLAAL